MLHQLKTCIPHRAMKTQFALRTVQGLYLSGCLLGIGVLAGCGGSSAAPPPVPKPLGPLSFNEWKSIGDPSKYAPETLKRLRESDASLRTHAKWKTFMREVINPEFRREFKVPGKS